MTPRNPLSTLGRFEVQLSAVPHDGSPPITLGTRSRAALYALLAQLGIDPQACDICTVRLASAEYVAAWDRIETLEFGHADSAPAHLACVLSAAEWRALHDAVFEATQHPLAQPDLERLVPRLPASLREAIADKGPADAQVAAAIIAWCRAHRATVLAL